MQRSYKGPELKKLSLPASCRGSSCRPSGLEYLGPSSLNSYELQGLHVRTSASDPAPGLPDKPGMGSGFRLGLKMENHMEKEMGN